MAHQGTSNKLRQIDYVLVDRRVWAGVCDSGSVQELDIGIDHQAVCFCNKPVKGTIHFPLDAKSGKVFGAKSTLFVMPFF